MTPSSPVETLLASMDVPDMVRALLCPQHFTWRGDLPVPTGSVFVHRAPSADLRRTIARLRDAAPYPPLITTDMEHGPGAMIVDGTAFPSMLAAGVADDEALAYAMGAASAREGRAVGYNWSLSPCVDLLTRHDSPMVSLRSPGCSPASVARIAAAVVRGMQDNGMMATAKHFPGDGYDGIDQHLGVPRNPLSQDAWREGPGRVYRALVQAGVAAVMAGHIALPAFDPGRGTPPPASLSETILTGLLHEELGFAGIVVSDAVNMAGFAGVDNVFDASVRFLRAGGHILLFADPGVFVSELCSRVKSGTLPQDVLVNRVRRVLSVQHRFGLLDDRPVPQTEADSAAHDRAAAEMTRRSIVLMRDRADLLPVTATPDTTVCHVGVGIGDDPQRAGVFEAVNTTLQEAGAAVTALVPQSPEELFDLFYTRRFSWALCSVFAFPDYGTNQAGLRGPNARLLMGGWMRLGTPVVFAALGDPFFAHTYDAVADTVVATAGITSHTASALVATLTGKNAFAASATAAALPATP